eukprot:6207856-Pleurochrysis_carterae.AAC.1
MLISGEDATVGETCRRERADAKDQEHGRKTNNNTGQPRQHAGVQVWYSSEARPYFPSLFGRRFLCCVRSGLASEHPMKSRLPSPPSARDKHANARTNPDYLPAPSHPCAPARPPLPSAAPDAAVTKLTARRAQPCRNRSASEG